MSSTLCMRIIREVLHRSIIYILLRVLSIYMTYIYKSQRRMPGQGSKDEGWKWNLNDTAVHTGLKSEYIKNKMLCLPDMMPPSAAYAYLCLLAMRSLPIGRRKQRTWLFYNHHCTAFYGKCLCSMSAVVNKQSMTYIRMAQSGANRVTFLFMLLDSSAALLLCGGDKPI